MKTGYKWRWRSLAYVSTWTEWINPSQTCTFTFKLGFFSYWGIYFYHGPQRLIKMNAETKLKTEMQRLAPAL